MVEAVKNRTVEIIRESIDALVVEAEKMGQNQKNTDSSEDVMVTKEDRKLNLSSQTVTKNLENLDILMSQEAVIALQAEFARFSNVFDTEMTQESIRHAVNEAIVPLIEAWINQHMTSIVKDVVTDALGKIVDTRWE